MIQALTRLFRQFTRNTASAKVEKKPAIALITYCRADYFEKVLHSILSQRIGDQTVGDVFDLFVFQDGLLATENAEQHQGHSAIAALCQTQIAQGHYMAQATNQGVAMHFDYVERLLFETQDRPWVVFCEDDLVLAPGYLETLCVMAQQFRNDPRVGMFSCFATNSNQPIDKQQANQHALTSMAHHWAFGMHKAAWLKRQPLVDEYLKLLQGNAYRQRPHGRIQNWHTFCGFKPGSTSQDYAKACAMAAAGMVKVSSYANFGSYIGEYGLHFTPEIYAKQGYANSVIFPHPITQPFALDDARYAELISQQRNNTLEAPQQFDPVEFAERLSSGKFTPSYSDQWQQNSVSESDVVAAYKMFLGRLPETRQVITSRIGIQPERLLASFLTSPEFRSRKQFSPIILALAREIVDQNKAAQQTH
jgi:hypothetical protein